MLDHLYTAAQTQVPYKKTTCSKASERLKVVRTGGHIVSANISYLPSLLTQFSCHRFCIWLLLTLL